MATVFPTKSNLIQTKKSLSLASLGYDLLDRKRTIMMREMMKMLDQVNEVQSRIKTTYSRAYSSLERANVSCGQRTVMAVVSGIPERGGIGVRYRSVMGIEIPEITKEPRPTVPPYGMHDTDESFDEAYAAFCEVRDLICEMAQIESGVYRLAKAVKQTQKRANALKNVVIPRLSETEKYIRDYLEEKEREEFTAQKVVKGRKNAD